MFGGEGVNDGFDKRRSKEVWERLEKLRLQSLEASKLLTRSGHIALANNLILSIGFLTGVVSQFVEHPKDKK